MTPLEFKAWFDGFSEGIDKAPTQKQWVRIKERVTEIDGHAITERIFVDRYRHYSHSTYPYYSPGLWTTGNTMASTAVSVSAPVFNSLAAMNSLGKSEIAELS